MRQRDEKFIAFLNRIRVGSQKNYDLDYLNHQCLHLPPMDPKFPFLFYKRKDVNEHNKRMLSTIPRDIIVLDAIDEHEDNYNGIRSYTHTTTLATQLCLKQNIIVEIYFGNYNTQDGPVNGSDGLFKAYKKHSDFDIVWIKFNYPEISQ